MVNGQAVVYCAGRLPGEDTPTFSMKQTAPLSTILYIGGNPDVGRFLECSGTPLDQVEIPQEALSRAMQNRPRLVIVDQPLDLIAQLKALYPTLPIIMLGSRQESSRFLQLDVSDYLSWPAHKKRLLERVQTLRHSAPLDGSWRASILSHNPLMEELLCQAYQVSHSKASVLIGGASGTGKELLARAIHAASPRAVGAFVAVNCSAIPEPLFESELFGHCKGAFTGATRDHIGLMRAAQGGTLFLDEIGEMPRSFQAKLLRSLQDMRVRPVGGLLDEPVDIRVISATHVDLEQAMREGQFREDLYYRLNVVTLTLPRLTERPDDIAGLADSFLGYLALSYGEPVRVFSPEALDALRSYSWPGNVRQLRNVVEHCVALSTTAEIPLSLVSKALNNREEYDYPSLEEARERFEQAYLRRLLHVTQGNVARAARIAKRNRTEFYRLLTRHNLEPSAFK